jgi:8-oxo-dGTP diphosphatase
MTRDELDVIMAAGAVLWRRSQGGEVEVAVIHRPAYDDWSLPKGKVEGGEALIACAYRELLEETGYQARFGPYLGDTFYEVNGVPKVVRYWAAQATDGELDAFDRAEVDQLEWLTPKRALERLTIKDDRKILKKFINLGRDTKPFILLRHAEAVSRDEWMGDDGDRPLTDEGERQVKSLIASLHVYRISEMHTSDAIRCFSTVAPIADAYGIRPVVNSDLSEYTYSRDKKSAARYIKNLFERDEAILVCGHNPILSKIVKRMARRLDMYKEDFSLGKGDAFIIHRSQGKIYDIDHLKVN